MNSLSESDIQYGTGVIDQFITTQRIIDSEYDPEVDRYMENRDLSGVYLQLSPRELFPHHNADHSLNVWRRGSVFLNIYERALKSDPSIENPKTVITPKMREVHRVGSQGHDFKIRARRKIDTQGMLILEQYMGPSETESARLIKEFMLSENRRLGFEFFTKRDIQVGMACALLLFHMFQPMER